MLVQKHCSSSVIFLRNLSFQIEMQIIWRSLVAGGHGGLSFCLTGDHLGNAGENFPFVHVWLGKAIRGLPC